MPAAGIVVPLAVTITERATQGWPASSLVVHNATTPSVTSIANVAVAWLSSVVNCLPADALASWPCGIVVLFGQFALVVSTLLRWRYTDARPMPRVLAISLAPMPVAARSRTRWASMLTGLPL